MEGGGGGGADKKERLLPDELMVNKATRSIRDHCSRRKSIITEEEGKRRTSKAGNK